MVSAREIETGGILWSKVGQYFAQKRQFARKRLIATLNTIINAEAVTILKRLRTYKTFNRRRVKTHLANEVRPKYIS